MPEAGLEATIAALRERGASRIDPVRFHFVEALARRAATHDGPARRVLDARVAELARELGDAVDRAAIESPDTRGCIETPAPHRGALAELARMLARPAAPARVPDGACARDANAAPTSGESDALRYFRRTWSRLSASQRLAQSRSALPGNAGPLHSQHLVHRALTRLSELSPEYLERVVAQVDDLLWLERALEAADGELARALRDRGSRARQR